MKTPKTIQPSKTDKTTPLDIEREGDIVVMDSQALFGNENEVGIRHEGQLYRLRKTRYGKLILNK